MHSRLDFQSLADKYIRETGQEAILRQDVPRVFLNLIQPGTLANIESLAKRDPNVEPPPGRFTIGSGRPRVVYNVRLLADWLDRRFNHQSAQAIQTIQADQSPPRLPSPPILTSSQRRP